MCSPIHLQEQNKMSILLWNQFNLWIFFTKIWFDTAAADILIDMERQTKTNFHSIDRTVRTATHSKFIQDQYHAKSEVFLCTYFAFYEFGSLAICKYVQSKSYTHLNSVLDFWLIWFQYRSRTSHNIN